MDGDKRTVPDGSSFAWQHWSHTFEYAFTAGSGDWRTAGFPVAGQEYRHELLTCETDLHAGPHPPALSLAEVTPAGMDLMALKPRGNPLVPMAQPDPRDGVTVRLRRISGPAAPGAATVRLFRGVAAASVTGLLEQGGGAAANCDDGTATVEVPDHTAVTLAIDPGDLADASYDPIASSLAGNEVAPEPAQPVFTRYWLHGKGPAPAGNLPVAVHLSPGLLAPRPGESSAIRLTVACGPAPVSGTVTVDVPPGLRLVSVRPAGPQEDGLVTSAGPAVSRPLHYHLEPSGFASWDLIVAVPPGAPTARHFVTAMIIDEAGQMLEDAVVVVVGEPPPPGGDLTFAEFVPLFEAAGRAEAAEAELSRITGHLELPPGGSGEIAVRLANHTASELRGEAQVISPHGSWAAVAPWTMGFSVRAASASTMTFTVGIPSDARPGQRWWALVKVMYFGRLRYSEPVWVSVTG